MNIIYIHGGNIRETQDQYREYLKTTTLEYKVYDNSPLWSDHIRQKFPMNRNILTPRMPRKQRAQYGEWKLTMDRCLEFITPDEPVMWIGRSLGALFLAKYLSENPQRADQIHLVSGIYYPGSKEKFTNNTFPCGFNLLSGREEKLSQHNNIHLRHSTDDPVTDYSNTKKLSSNISKTTLHTFSDRNHFLQADFPELRTEIRQSLR